MSKEKTSKELAREKRGLVPPKAPKPQGPVPTEKPPPSPKGPNRDKKN